MKIWQVRVTLNFLYQSTKSFQTAKLKIVEMFLKL